MGKKMKDYRISSDKIHATLIVVNSKGVLLVGDSGSGKSDLALRLIERGKAVLVADDVVCLEAVGGRLYGKADESIKGMLEVRGLGIVRYSCLNNAEISLVVELKNTMSEIERLPINDKETILGLEIPKIALYAKQSSAVDKLCVGLRLYTNV